MFLRRAPIDVNRLNTVVVPADQAHLLSESQCDCVAQKFDRPMPHVPGCPAALSAKWYVVHTANIKPGAVVTLAVAEIEPCPNCDETDDHECFLDGESYGPFDGFRPVGTATVVNCWPIVGDDQLDVEHVGMSYIAGQYRLYICGPGTSTAIDITGQIVGNPQPGLFMLELDSIRHKA